LEFGSSDSPAALSLSLGPVFARHGIMRAIVFGSVARGDASRHSDLDLIVIQNTRKPFLDRYDGILAEITALVRGRDVDLLIYTPDEIERMADRPLIAAALREGKIIYESQQESIPG